MTPNELSSQPTLFLIEGGQSNSVKTEYVILVGDKEVNREILAAHSLSVIDHWRKLPTERPCIPLQVDRILLLSDVVDVLLTKTARDIAEKEALPITFTHSSLANLAFDLIHKTHEPKDEVVVEALTLNNRSKNTMETTNNSNEIVVDGRTNGLNTQRKEKKLDFIREMLKKNPELPTADILERVAKRFKHGITPTAVHALREKEFGIKFGPRGMVLKADDNTPELSEGAVSAPAQKVARKTRAAASGAASARLTKLLAQVQETMAAEGVRYLKIPAEGTAQVVFEVTQEISLSH